MAMRWGLLSHRRRYCVPGANSLWHIDGHHALIRWRIVTHGGIDGFSRLIVFLQSSTNNRAETVAQLFMSATEQFGFPDRIRADRGGENNDVKRIMEDRQQGSFIAGRSVHNSRIERLWRDVYYGVVQTFYSLFYYLESNDLLDTDSELDIWCIHTIYLPVINQALNEFQLAYNHHPLRTERNRTPLQLWHNDQMRQQIRRQPHLTVNNHLLGIDADAPLPQIPEENHEAVEVPQTRILLDDHNVHELLSFAAGFAQTNNFYIDHYCDLKQAAEQSIGHLSAGQ
jgi:hypothetical protein